KRNFLPAGVAPAREEVHYQRFTVKGLKPDGFTVERFKIELNAAAPTAGAESRRDCGVFCDQAMTGWKIRSATQQNNAKPLNDILLSAVLCRRGVFIGQALRSLTRPMITLPLFPSRRRAILCRTAPAPAGLRFLWRG